jgi:hypothetical protein
MDKSNFESAFVFYSDNPIVFHPTDLKYVHAELRDELQSHNIYIIARTNRTWFLPETLRLDKNAAFFKVDIAIQNGFRFDTQEIHYPILADTKAINVSPFPHKEIFLLDKENNIVKTLNASQLAITLPSEIKPAFEVLYSGRSFGFKRQLNITDRLLTQHHRKFKEILIDTQGDCPDKELFIFSFNYAYSRQLLQMTSRGPYCIDDNELKRLDYLKALSVTRREKVNIIEEALINYFLPRYNELCKDSLSRLSTKAIRYFQEMDVSGLVVELTLNETEIKLYSERTLAKSIHIIPFAIFDDRNRFTYVNDVNMEAARKAYTDYLLKYK